MNVRNLDWSIIYVSMFERLSYSLRCLEITRHLWTLERFLSFKSWQFVMLGLLQRLSLWAAYLYLYRYLIRVWMDVIGDIAFDFRVLRKLWEIMMFANCVISKKFINCVLASKRRLWEQLLGGLASRAVPVRYLPHIANKFLNSGIGFYTLVPRPAGGGGSGGGF